jgi:hypothetical protein
VVCKNPLLAEERARKRAELLAATEKELARIAARVQRAQIASLNLAPVPNKKISNGFRCGAAAGISRSASFGNK